MLKALQTDLSKIDRWWLGGNAMDVRTTVENDHGRDRCHPQKKPQGLAHWGCDGTASNGR
jgi:hypothetical protein